MGNLEDESTVSIKELLERVAEIEGGEKVLRSLLLAEKGRLSDMSIQAGGDNACLEEMLLIDQLVVVLDVSITPDSPGIGTTGQDTRKVSRGRH